jgi:hypothetical protein
VSITPHPIRARCSKPKHAQARLPLKEKFRILLELQRQDLPLLARHRPLQPWEYPWTIEP